MELQKRTQDAEAATERMAKEHAEKLQEMNAATAEAQVACSKLDDAELRATQAAVSVDKAHQVCAKFTLPTKPSLLVSPCLPHAMSMEHMHSTCIIPFSNLTVRSLRFCRHVYLQCHEYFFQQDHVMCFTVVDCFSLFIF
jgi:hypothetical protein